MHNTSIKTALLAVLVFTSSVACCQTQNFQYFFGKAKEAYTAKDYLTFYKCIAEAHRLHPYHQVILYNHGVAAALVGKPDEALMFLKRAILVNAEFDLKNADLASLKNQPDFYNLLKLQTDLETPVVHSTRAFVLTDRQLHTEGITFDPSTQSFFLGSIHKRKVVKVSKDRVVNDFVPGEKDGMTSVLGIKADALRNLLWVSSSPMTEMQNYDSALSSILFKYELKTGKLLNSYKSQEITRSVFGDLTLDQNGNAFVSDSQNNIIFTVNEARRSLDKFFESKDFWNIQGITFSDDGKSLFIADYIKGIFNLDLGTKELRVIPCSLDVSLKGIDGLTFYHNSLIAVQNGVNPLRVMRYYLDNESNAIVRSEIVDWKHPDFNEPTMGTLVGDEFYYIANSQWGGYENGKIKPADQLQDIVILKAKLK